MPNIDLSILNQRQTPAFYADVFANRPAAGFVGRIFISTNTFAFYRDNGTSWDLIGGPGTGTVTGTGANGQVTFWNGASTITGSNDLFWDATNGHLGVNTNAPGTALDVHHDQPTVAILNQTVATNDVRIGFQNNGVGLWRIGAFYNAGANDFGIYDAVAAIQPVTVKKTTGQVLIGTSTVGSGKLVVASASSDNGIQIVGATAPSLRIDSAESGPTKRAGLGISTATNNFIQGSADRDFCIFNGSTAAASPILFGIYDAAAVNVQEAARISAARNFLIGTTTDAGQKLQVNGQSKFLQSSANIVAIFEGDWDRNTTNNNQIYVRGYSNTNKQLRIGFDTTSDYGYIQALISGTGTNAIALNPSGGNVGIGTALPSRTLHVLGQTGVGTVLKLEGAPGATTYLQLSYNGATNVQSGYIGYDSSSNMSFFTNDTERGRFTSSGNLLIGTTTDSGSKLQVNGSAIATSFASTTGTISVPPATPTTFFTATTKGIYIAHIYLDGNQTQIWDASIIFNFNVTNILVANQINGTNVSITVSGANINVTQIGGITFTFNYEIIRIA